MPIRGCQCGAVRNEVAAALGCALHVNKSAGVELGRTGSRDTAFDLNGAWHNWPQSRLPIVTASAGARQFAQGAH